MIRPAAWISLLAIGLAFAGSELVARAETPAGAASQLSAGEPADYVVELPTDDDRPRSPVEASDPHAAALDDDSLQDSKRLSDEFDSAPLDDATQTPATETPQTEIIKERFVNGSVKIERQVTQDAQGNYLNHGPWKMWDEKGNLVAQGEYQLGERTGEWIRWYRVANEVTLFSKMPYQQFVGPFISQATFKHGELDGRWIIYDNQMRKISQWAFTRGKRHGTSTWWFTNGHKMRECDFRDGDMDGYYIEWTADGAERTKEIYQSGRKLAEKTTHYPGGQKKSQGMYLFARDVEQTPDDWWNCQLLVTNPTGKDEQHGKSIVWHANGQQALEGEYEHDVQVGVFTWWHPNSQKSLAGRYERGKQQDTWIWWHANGQKSIQGQYTQGTPSGRWTWWKEDGKVAQAADLSNAEGVVIDVPRPLDSSSAPRASMPVLRPSTRR